MPGEFPPQESQDVPTVYTSKTRRVDLDPDIIAGAKALTDQGDDETASRLIKKAAIDDGEKAEFFTSWDGKGTRYAVESGILNCALRQVYGKTVESNFSRDGVNSFFIDGQEYQQNDPYLFNARKYVFVLEDTLKEMGFDPNDFDDVMVQKLYYGLFGSPKEKHPAIIETFGTLADNEKLSEEERLLKFKDRLKSIIPTVME